MNLGDLVIKLSRTLLTVVEVPDPAVDAVPAGLLPHTAGQARRAQVPTPEPGQVEAAAAAELGESRANFLSFLNTVMISKFDHQIL